MKIPGSLGALADQLKAAGYGTPTALTFDSDGNLINITLGPAITEPAAASGRPSILPHPTKRPLSMINAVLPPVETRVS